MKKLHKRKLHLISNMYPSESNIRYGIFVKRFEELLNDGFDIRKIVIIKNYKAINKLLAYIVAYIKITKLLFTSGKDDIIYIHFPLHFAPILLPLAFSKKILVLNFHGSDAIFDSTTKKVLSVFLKPVVKRSTIIVPSYYFMGVVASTFNISKKNIHIFPSGGVDKNIFYPLPKTNHTHFTLGFVSNFIEPKGWKVLLDAFRIIINKKEIDSLELHMVGDGPDKSKIISYINKYELNVKVINSVIQSELVNTYSKFDLFIFPTYRREESLGLVGLEAMMCGKSIIASNIAGPGGYVIDGVNGFLAVPNNPKDLADKIITYYKLSTEKKNIMIKQAIKTANKYESHLVVNDLIMLLNKL